MAKRKVANLLALAVLGTVVQKPMHPYEIASVLRARGKDSDIEIKWGSLYTVVRNLAKHGFLEVVDNTREGARPERTIYAITSAGRAELVDWTRDLVATPHPDHPPFKAGLSMLAALSPDDAARALEQRLVALDRGIDTLRAALDADQAGGIPRLFLVESEYELALRVAEAAWVRGLLGELTDGTLPDLDHWRRWHETGELSPELTELAERGTRQQ